MKASGMRPSTRMPPASTPSWRLSCALPTRRNNPNLLAAQLELLHELRGAFTFVLIKRADFLRLVATRRGAQLEKALFHFGAIQGVDDRAVDHRDDVLRRIGRHQEAVPEIEFVVRIARLGDGWNLGKRGQPRFRRHGEREAALSSR